NLGERLSERGAVGGLAAEQLGCFVIALGANLDGIARPNHFEELLNVSITEPNASVRSSLADGARDVGSVNAVAFAIETNPARTKRTVVARTDYLSGVVVGGMRDPIDDLKLAGWARTDAGTDRNREHA